MELADQQEGDTHPQIPSGGMYGAYAPTPPSEDFFKYRIEGNDIVEEVKHLLMGEVWDEDKKKYDQLYDPMINKDGMNKIINVMYACGINKGVYLGNLTMDQILYKCKMIKKQLSLLLFKNYYKYDVPSEMRNLLVTIVINTVHSGLSRSEGGREADQLSTAGQRHEIYSYDNRQKNESIWNRIRSIRKQ